MSTYHKMILFAFFLSTGVLGAQNDSSSKRPEAQGWWNADRGSIGLAPKPREEKNAIVQIYAARAYSWRGTFAVHTWVSVKEEDASEYTSYEVMGFGGEREIPIIRMHNQAPDRKWYGNSPDLIFDLRGEAAQLMIPKIRAAVESYPYPKTYRLFPGPNSNKFVSHVIRNTAGIYVELPPHSIGKDWIGQALPVALSETRTGFQVSLFGLMGFTMGLAEGIEINLLGMAFGIDVLRPALKLPFVGRIGLKDKPVF